MHLLRAKLSFLEPPTDSILGAIAGCASPFFKARHESLNLIKNPATSMPLMTGVFGRASAKRVTRRHQ